MCEKFITVTSWLKSNEAELQMQSTYKTRDIGFARDCITPVCGIMEISWSCTPTPIFALKINSCVFRCIRTQLFTITESTTRLLLVANISRRNCQTPSIRGTVYSSMTPKPLKGFGKSGGGEVASESCPFSGIICIKEKSIQRRKRKHQVYAKEKLLV
jgi:hypothetical protein